jgi:hypothetical protein
MTVNFKGRDIDVSSVEVERFALIIILSLRTDGNSMMLETSVGSRTKQTHLYRFQKWIDHKVTWWYIGRRK